MNPKLLASLTLSSLRDRANTRRERETERQREREAKQNWETRTRESRSWRVPREKKYNDPRASTNSTLLPRVAIYASFLSLSLLVAS